MRKIFKIEQSTDVQSVVENRFWDALMGMEAENLWVIITDKMPNKPKRSIVDGKIVESER